MTPTETVIEVTEVSVEGPLVDRAPATTTRLGLFSACTTALEWLGCLFAEGPPDDVGGLLYYRLDEVTLDRELRITRTRVFSSADERHGTIDGDGEQPWGGREPEECTYKPGDRVGFVSPYAVEYRIGVVLAQPPTPDSARRGGLTVADDRYLIGTLDADGSAETDEHAHMHRALLFRADHELPGALRAALASRRRRYGR